MWLGSNPLFAYQATTIRVDNSQTCAAAACTLAEQLAIYNAARVVGPGSDAAAGGDAVSYDGTDTIDVGSGNQALNDQQNAALSSVLAVVFTVQVL